MKKIMDIFDNTVYNRAAEIGNEFIANNIEYKKSENNVIRMSNQIRKDLPKHHKYLINDYDLAVSRCNAIDEKIIYMQAFKDGFEFAYDLVNSHRHLK